MNFVILKLSVSIETEYENTVLDSYDTENYVLYSDLHDHLRHALEQVPELYREAFVLNRFEGLKYREIAEKLNLPLGTVKSRIFFTRQKLQEELKDFR